jgi:hypothetical protein
MRTMGLIRRRSAVLLTATILAGAAFTVEPAVMRDLTVDAVGGRLSVGAVRTSLIGAALAQSDAVALDDVVLTLGPMTYKAKRIEFTGVTSSRADIDALFDKASTEPLAARLARISAKQITVPELVSEQAVGKEVQRGVQKNLVATDIRNGRIAQILIESGTADGGNDKARSRITQGRTTVTDIDAAGMARVWVERGAPNAPMTKLYSAFGVEDVRASITGTGGGEFRIARIAGRDFYGRPTEDSWAGAISLAAELGGMENPSEKDGNRLMAAMADMLGAFDIAQAEINGMEIRGKNGPKEGTGRIARMAYTGAVNGQTPDARIEGFEVASPDGTARIATIAFTGFSFENTFKGLKSFQGKDMKNLDPAELRKLVPTIGTVRFSGFDFDLPNEADKGPKPERIKFTLKNLELTADKPVDGIPSNLRLSLQNLAFPVPPNTKEEGLKDIAALGYKTLDVSFTAAASWNEPGNELVVREVSTKIEDMGLVSLRGVLGSVTKDVFSTDSAIAMVALVGATAKNVDLTVENGGLFDRYLAQESKKQKKTPEALRREFGTMAAVGIPALLGSSQQAKSIGQAVGRFIAKPSRLVISAKAKNGTGLGFADVMSLGEPAEILSLVDVTTAND